MKILLLSRYEDLGASSRIRSYQYLPYLRAQGHDIHIVPLLSNFYLQQLYAYKRLPVVEILSSYLHRSLLLLKSGSYDIIWLEYEAFPWIPHWLESLIMKSTVPYIVDYDDAIFHRYDQHPVRLVRILMERKIDKVMKHAALVIAGNDYIKQHAIESGAKRVEILPTAVDLDRFTSRAPAQNTEFTVGWIGTPQTVHYLETIKDALKIVCRNGQGRLVTIGSTVKEFDGVSMESRRWSKETEVEELSKIDVGIMPLIDSLWEQGKSGNKLIHYMASSRAVVASPVGVNRNIVENGVNGFLASKTEEWATALETLRENRAQREEMGRAGRQKVERLYCLSVTAPRMARLLADVAEGHR